MNLSTTTDLLIVYCDLLIELITKIQLYAATQGYTVCRLHTKNPIFKRQLELDIYGSIEVKKNKFLSDKNEYMIGLNKMTNHFL